MVPIWVQLQWIVYPKNTLHGRRILDFLGLGLSRFGQNPRGEESWKGQTQRPKVSAGQLLPASSARERLAGVGRVGTSQHGPESDVLARTLWVSSSPSPFDLSHAMPPPLIGFQFTAPHSTSLPPFPSHYYNMFPRLPCAATSLSLSLFLFLLVSQGAAPSSSILASFSVLLRGMLV